MGNWLGRGVRLPVLAGGVALVLYPLFWATPYTLRILAVAGVYALLVIGYQFIFGYAGALSLAQGCFFGLGAYVTGILGSQLGWSFPLTFPLSILAPGLLALLVAAPVLRLESHYFALATLGIGQVVLLAAINWQSVTGGANGIPGVPGIVILDHAIGRGWPLMLCVWAAAALGGLFAWQVMRGLYGRCFHLMRENELAAVTLGIDTAALRATAFLLSALFAGAAGALYAHVIGVISPEALEFPIMVACLSMAVVGGRARVAGAVAGALLLVHLPEWLRFLEKSYLIAYGAALLLVIVLAPWGLIGALERLRARLAPEMPTACPMPGSPRPPRPSRRRADRPEAAPLLEVENLGMSFGGLKALDRVSLTIRRGELVGLIGPNGSGKTTLANLITGLHRPIEGRVRLAGRDITGMPAFRIARLGIARSFQSVNLVDDMTVLDNVAVARAGLEGVGLTTALATGRTERRLARAEAEAMARLDAFELAAFAQAPGGSLPHGIKRRVEIARALALEPELLILDEPVAGLGPAERLLLAERLEALRCDGLTLLVIEHNMPWLMALADRVICLDNGRVIAAGRPEEVRGDARVIEAYLGTPGPRAKAP